jgi:hypothetical protein
MKKGISPAITIVLMLVIVISITTSVFLFFGSATKTAAQSGEEQAIQKLKQTGIPVIESVDKNKVYVRSSGGSHLTNPTFFVAGKHIDATGPSSLEPGKIGEYILDKNQLVGLPKVAEVKVSAALFSNSIIATVRDVLANIIQAPDILLSQPTGLVVGADEDGIIFRNTTGSDVMVIADNGEVGVGTNDPNRLLELNSISPSIMFYDSDSASDNKRWEIGSVSNGEFIIKSHNDGLSGGSNALKITRFPSAQAIDTIQFWTSNSSGLASSEKVRITSSGNVGIGTTTPGAKLHIATNQDITSNPDSTGLLLNSLQANGGSGQKWLLSNGVASVDNADFAIRDVTSGEYRLVINNNNGNVGIGTASPGAKLEVAGQVKITGGTPGSGKVLTSDATGLATWQTSSGKAVVGPFTHIWTIGGASNSPLNLVVSETGVSSGNFPRGVTLPFVAPGNGSIVGLSFAVTQDHTITWNAFKNDVNTGLSVTGTTQYGQTTATPGTYTFVAGDRLDIRVSASSNLAVGGAIAGWLLIQFD